MPNDSRLKVDPFALAIAALLYAEHLIFGANRQDLGLFFAVLHLLILAILMAVTRGAQPPRLPLSLPSALFGLVFAIGLFSILPLGPPLAHPLWSYVPGVPASISLDPVATRLTLVELAGLGCVFLIGAGLGSDRARAGRFALYLIYGGILYCAWAFLSWVTTPNAIFGVPRPYGAGRLGASFLSSNTAATLFASLAVMSLMLLLGPVTRARRPGERRRLEELLELWPPALLLLVALPCLLLTGSRGGLLSFVAAVLVGLGYLTWIKSTKQSLTAGFAATICLLLFAGSVVFLIGGDKTATRLGAIDPLNNDRLQLFAAYWPMVKASPWLGYGLGAFRSVNFASMTLRNSPLLSTLGAAHNVYLEWLLQQGIPGALAMVGCVAVVLAATARGVARRSTQQALGAGCLAVAVVFAVHGLVDYAFEAPSMAAFFSAILGLGFGLSQRPAGAKARR
jgi:O-antigen ligase